MFVMIKDIRKIMFAGRGNFFLRPVSLVFALKASISQFCNFKMLIIITFMKNWAKSCSPLDFCGVGRRCSKLRIGSLSICCLSACMFLIARGIMVL